MATVPCFGSFWLFYFSINRTFSASSISVSFDFNHFVRSWSGHAGPRRLPQRESPGARDQSTHIAVRAGAAHARKGVQRGRVVRPVNKNIVHQHDVLVRDVKPDLSLLNHRLRSQGRKIVAVKRDVQCSDRHFGVFDARDDFAQPFGDRNSTASDSHQSQSLDSTVLFHNFVCQVAPACVRSPMQTSVAPSDEGRFAGKHFHSDVMPSGFRKPASQCSQPNAAVKREQDLEASYRLACSQHGPQRATLSPWNLQDTESQSYEPEETSPDAVYAGLSVQDLMSRRPLLRCRLRDSCLETWPGKAPRQQVRSLLPRR